MLQDIVQKARNERVGGNGGVMALALWLHCLMIWVYYKLSKPFGEKVDFFSNWTLISKLKVDLTVWTFLTEVWTSFSSHFFGYKHGT